MCRVTSLQLFWMSLSLATILAMLEILSDTLDRFIERIKFLINMAETIKETNVEKQTTRMIVFWSFNGFFLKKGNIGYLERIYCENFNMKTKN